ncbi:MAG: CoA-binding protein [Chloroflexi bacterium]|nr:CoA-binding protein [Chloroflexota bacterium]
MGSDRALSLEYIFHPRSVAVCGAFNHPFRWWLKEYYIDSFMRNGYSGQFYLVDPRGGEIAGRPIFGSLRQIPGPVDHVVCCVSAAKAPSLLEECRAIGVKSVQIFTAGFAETGEPDDVQLQEKLVQAARGSDMRIIGPNCMGIYYPKGGLSFAANFPTESGPIGLLCQSGGNTTYITRLAADHGLRFSKAVSYGNACDVNECDLLEYMAADPETKVIAAYIEGTRDGARLMRSLTHAAAAKPLVVFKGGYTVGGARATASHTGALAGSESTWDGLLRQTGAIRVYAADEMVDMLMALVRMRPPRGPNVCAVGNGGGSSVSTTDECEQAGLKMVPTPPEIRERLKKFISLEGTMIHNPFDTTILVPIQKDGTFDGQPVPAWEYAVKAVKIERGDKSWGDFLDVMKDWRALDLMLFHYSVDINPMNITEWRMGTAVGRMLAGATACQLPKAMVFQGLANEEARRAVSRVQRMCQEAGLPFFVSVRGAAKAIHRLIDYNREHPGMVARAQGQED